MPFIGSYTILLTEMIELARHIEILLLDNDCVIVPQFGGFMAHHASSVYSDSEALFLPPSRTLGFNPQLTINDSLLVQSYVEAYDISYPEALRRIEEKVNELSQCIANEGFCELPNIGTLSLNGEGAYNFQPIAAGILTPSLYGLSSFEMKPLAANAEQKDVNSSSQALGYAENGAKDENVSNDDSDDYESAKVISIKVEKLKRIAIAAAMVVFFALVSLPLGHRGYAEINLCTIDSGVLGRLMPSLEIKGVMPRLQVVKESIQVDEESINVAERTSGITEKEGLSTIAKNDVTISKNEAVQLKKIPETEYVLVLASHVAKTNADEYVSKLQALGLTDARVVEKGARKVVCGSYASEAEANHARSLLSTLGINDAWVLLVK